MPEKKRAHAPYNFVPFSNKILLPYDSPKDLPAHDRIDPELKTGEIHVTMEAETPVFVSDGDRTDPHFCRGANGKYMLPGSTVRGMTRENMQILGFGLLRPGEDLEDYQIYFREMAAARGSTGDALKQYYQSALGVQNRKSKSGSSYSIPENVRSGYLCRVGDSYVIRPTKGAYLRVSRKFPDVRTFGTQPARTVAVLYHSVDGIVKHIRPADSAEDGLLPGVLLFTGRPVGRQPNHLYLFPAADPEAETVEVSKEDVLSYAADLESRQNSLKAYYDLDFWVLPREGEMKPVFYLRHEGHLYFGMSLFLRIGYPYSLSQGLPKHHRDVLAQYSCPLDFPHAVLGFVTGTASYRSRVSFGDFQTLGDPAELPQVRTILATPRASYYPGYVLDGKPYIDGDFQLRGYKQYWMKAPCVPPVSEGKEKAGSTLRPLPAGTKFRGVIRYKNLTGAELGLLLWSLRLEKDCRQTIGSGKPYGYGRMKLTIDRLAEFDTAALYGDLAAGAETAPEDAVERYIAAYDAFAMARLDPKKSKKGVSLRKRPELQDLFFLKSAIRSGQDTAYMELDAYKNTASGLPLPKEFRENAKEEQPPEDPYAALLAKWGAKH